MNIFDYRRIAVLGNNGSGKSYLPKKLANATGLPAIHLDTHFWLPNWQTPPEDEWLKKVAGFTAMDRWIIDGNVSYGESMDLRFKRADLIIFLDTNPLICIAGVIKRHGKNVRTLRRTII
ncbi:MAG: hypothetical protein FWC93_03655 [Defluviitaleaceae bacterium]|nr:hypothetical protein [Defluviitaleaceae bacterium]